MLTRVVLPHGARLSIGRLFATSVPRWNVPTPVKGTATAPLDADAIKAQHKTDQQTIQKAQLEDRRKNRLAFIRTVFLVIVGFLLLGNKFTNFFFGFKFGSGNFWF